MPWDESDAESKTKKANTPEARSQWSAVANSALAGGASEGSAIRQANGVVRDRKKKTHMFKGKK